MATSREPNQFRHLQVVAPRETRRPAGPRVGWVRLGFGVAGGPIAWGVDRLVTSSLASSACRGGTSGAGLLGLSSTQSVELLVTVVAAIVALAAGLLSWQVWRQTQRPQEETATGSIRQVPFWSLGGLFLSGLFLFAIVATGGTTIALSGCH